jgi:hypothetical protein
MNPLENLIYYADTGCFYWARKRGPRRAGALAGSPNRAGYWTIRIGGKLLYAHRLAWFAIFGEFPPSGMDHINGNRADNRIANLRLATRQQNMGNSKPHRDSASGFRGVQFDKRRGRWCARVGHKYIGTFDTPQEAALAYQTAAEDIYGEYAFHRNRAGAMSLKEQTK